MVEGAEGGIEQIAGNELDRTGWCGALGAFAGNANQGWGQVDGEDRSTAPGCLDGELARPTACIKDALT